MKKIALGLILTMLLMGCSGDDDGNEASSCGTVCSVPLRNGENPGTPHPDIVGTYTLTYHLRNPDGPFSDGATATAELTSDNKLIFNYDGRCVTAENPFQTSPQEVNFRDNCVFNVLFAASAVNGGLNEINIASLDREFYGQFKE